MRYLGAGGGRGRAGRPLLAAVDVALLTVGVDATADDAQHHDLDARQWSRLAVDDEVVLRVEVEARLAVEELRLVTARLQRPADTARAQALVQAVCKA